jgi:uncharacterized protein (TIGR00369 family)
MSDPREDHLNTLAAGIPYLSFLGLRFQASGEGLTATLPYAPMLIGNPMIPALHGGVTSAFLEATAIMGLVWSALPDTPVAAPLLPKTIDLTVDYLRPGAPRDSHAQARIVRSGRRYASVHVEAWQDDRSRLFAQAIGHFLMPEGAR